MIRNRQEIFGVLQKFAKNVVRIARINLARNKRNASGKLGKSLDYKIKVAEKDTNVKFFGEDYAAYQDKGVSGTEKKYNTPFSYKSSSKLLGLEAATGKNDDIGGIFAKFAKRKGIQARDKKGRFLTYKQTGFAIAYNKKKFGIPPTYFFTKAREKAQERLPEELAAAIGKNILRNGK